MQVRRLVGAQECVLAGRWACHPSRRAYGSVCVHATGMLGGRPCGQTCRQADGQARARAGRSGYVGAGGCVCHVVIAIAAAAIVVASSIAAAVAVLPPQLQSPQLPWQCRRHWRCVIGSRSPLLRCPSVVGQQRQARPYCLNAQRGMGGGRRWQREGEVRAT